LADSQYLIPASGLKNYTLCWWCKVILWFMPLVLLLCTVYKNVLANLCHTKKIVSLQAFLFYFNEGKHPMNVLPPIPYPPPFQPTFADWDGLYFHWLHEELEGKMVSQ
jgi:hypothetical protein